MFKAGDAIIHPVRGAGVVIRVEKRQWRGNSDLYYRIKLLGQPSTRLMIPVSAAETLGLRRVIPRSKLSKVWRVLRATPKTLPDNHKKRYELLDGGCLSGRGGGQGYDLAAAARGQPDHDRETKV
jgi:RNA polymerase-interacting CarD/CdnL/TRCF family regulator